MTSAEFDAVARRGDTAPAELSPALLGLWWERCGDWEKAHEAVAADEEGRDAAWVHAYLHRREGDIGNARYWYRRAGRPDSTATLDMEWRHIADELLARP